MIWIKYSKGKNMAGALEKIFKDKGYEVSIVPMPNAAMVVCVLGNPVNVLTAGCGNADFVKLYSAMHADAAKAQNYELKLIGDWFYYGSPDAVALFENIDLNKEYQYMSEHHFEKYDDRAAEILSLMKEKETSNNQREKLESLVKPLIKKATKIIVKKPSGIHADVSDGTHLKSHFGGQPYFEKGEEWPKAKDDFRKSCNLEFVFQIFSEGDIVLPKNIKLVQFYYDMDGELSFETEDGGWLVKIYENLNIENAVIIKKPEEHNIVPYCEIEYESIQSLPDWEGIKSINETISDLSCELNDDEPWEPYQSTVEKLIGEPEMQTQLGGYPQLVQNDETPEDKNFEFLFQLDSEDNAGLMWGDCGLIYIFYNSKNKKTEYTLQCY
jgi:uncharacterized protein YwqG